MSAPALRALHGSFLVLPNVWDALSARLVEQAGAVALATSSAGVAWARGYRDGEQLPLDALVDVVAGITRASSLPLSVDFERGYGATPAAVSDAVARLVDAGAVGVNLEDADDPARLTATVAAVKKRFGDALFVNARACLVLRGLARGEVLAGEALVSELLTRARRYEDVGADGFFVPGLAEPRDLAAVAGGTALPLNVMLRPGLPPLPELRALGVRRLSVGAGLTEVAYAAARNAAVELLRGDGNYGAFLGCGLSYPEVNTLFSGLP